MIAHADGRKDVKMFASLVKINGVYVCMAAVQLLTNGRFDGVVKRSGGGKLSERHRMVPVRLQPRSGDRGEHAVAAVWTVRSRAECQGNVKFIILHYESVGGRSSPSPML